MLMNDYLDVGEQEEEEEEEEDDGRKCKLAKYNVD